MHLVQLVLEASLEQYGSLIYPDNSGILQRIETLDKCFSCGTVEEIIDVLIREGRFQTLDQCLDCEYRMSVQGFSGQISNDFCKGVRAQMVDKDYVPTWNPPSLEEVSNDMVDQYFSPISELEPELELPTRKGEAFI